MGACLSILVPPLMNWETLGKDLDLLVYEVGIIKGRWGKYGSARL